MQLNWELGSLFIIDDKKLYSILIWVRIVCTYFNKWKWSKVVLEGEDLKSFSSSDLAIHSIFFDVVFLICDNVKKGFTLQHDSNKKINNFFHFSTNFDKSGSKTLYDATLWSLKHLIYHHKTTLFAKPEDKRNWNTAGGAASYAISMEGKWSGKLFS